MAYTSSALAPRDLVFTQPRFVSKRPALPKRSLFSRLLDALITARMHQAERDIARYLADTGGKFTDQTEREIERRFLSNQPNW